MKNRHKNHDFYTMFFKIVLLELEELEFSAVQQSHHAF